MVSVVKVVVKYHAMVIYEPKREGEELRTLF